MEPTGDKSKVTLPRDSGAGPLKSKPARISLTALFIFGAVFAFVLCILPPFAFVGIPLLLVCLAGVVFGLVTGRKKPGD